MFQIHWETDQRLDMLVNKEKLNEEDEKKLRDFTIHLDPVRSDDERRCSHSRPRCEDLYDNR